MAKRVRYSQAEKQAFKTGCAIGGKTKAEQKKIRQSLNNGIATANARKRKKSY